MKKSVVIGLSVVLLIGIVYGLISYLPGAGNRAGVSDVIEKSILYLNGDKVYVNKENSNFEFEGFAVGKSHVASFDDWNGYLIVDKNKFVGVYGKINASSVNTGINRLDNHLRSDDFFDVAKYPVIEFTSALINYETNTMIGQLTFRNVTKELTIPVNISDNGLSTEFFLDTTPFNFKYTGVNKEVRIKFGFSKN